MRVNEASGIDDEIPPNFACGLNLQYACLVQGTFSDISACAAYVAE
jgi:hypothetical protein